MEWADIFHLVLSREGIPEFRNRAAVNAEDGIDLFRQPAQYQIGYVQLLLALR